MMRFFFGLVLLAAVGLISCNSNPEGYETADSGMKYKFYEQGDALRPTVGDVVTLKMSYGPKDSIIFSTDKIKEKVASFPLREPQFKGDVYEALTLMGIGDSANFIVSADSFFLVTANSRKLPKFIKKGSDLFFDIKLVSFQSTEEFNKARQADLAQQKADEKTKLDKYVKDNGLESKLTDAGIYYMIEKKGKGKKLQEGDMVELNYSEAILEGKQLYSSFERKHPVSVEIGKKFDTPGFMEGLKMMRKGEIARFVVPSEMGFAEKGRGQTIPPYTTLFYEIQILNVTDKETYQKEKKEKEAAREKEKKANSTERKTAEAQKISSYVKEKNLTVEPTASGLYFIEQKAGKGPQPKAGDVVKVHYTLYRLNGRKLQSSKEADRPFEFTVGRGEVIKGWDEALPKMQVGGTYGLLVPSSIAYGGNERGADIPPFTPLYFEVDLIELKPGK
jgi:FKBP-type peptidyl-prolyl cis-trans isomerase